MRRAKPRMRGAPLGAWRTESAARATGGARLARTLSLERLRIGVAFCCASIARFVASCSHTDERCPPPSVRGWGSILVEKRLTT